MSDRNGDKSRFGRERKQTKRKRELMRSLRKEWEAKKAPAKA